MSFNMQKCFPISGGEGKKIFNKKISLNSQFFLNFGKIFLSKKISLGEKGSQC